jgi:glutamate synthase domain-containing protein 2
MSEECGMWQYGAILLEVGTVFVMAAAGLALSIDLIRVAGLIGGTGSLALSISGMLGWLATFYALWAWWQRRWRSR